MDRSTRRMDQSESQPAPPSTDVFPAGEFYEEFFRFNSETARLVLGGFGPDNLPMGADKRHSSSPFPPETGKRTLETGPSYER